MMRQADSAIRLLLHLQAGRKRIEANPKEYDRGERLEHITGVAMTQALANRPVSPRDPESQNHTTETPARQPPAIAGPAPRITASPVSPCDATSRTTETEILPRQKSGPPPSQTGLRRPDPADFPIDPALLTPDQGEIARGGCVGARESRPKP